MMYNKNIFNDYLDNIMQAKSNLEVKTGSLNSDENKRVYNLIIDLNNISEKIEKTEAVFIKGDKETSIIYADVVINEKPFNLTGYSVILNVMENENTPESYECEIADAEKGKIKIKLPNAVVDENGICIFDLSFVKQQSILNSQRYSYLVLDSVGLYDLSQDTADSNILFKLIEEVKKLKSQNEEFINSATTSEESRRSNEEVRTTQENARQESIKNMEKTIDDKIVEINESKSNLLLEVNNAKESMTNKVDSKILEMQESFNSLSSENQETIQEVKAARDGETSLNERIKRDTYIGDKSLKQKVIDMGGLKESQDVLYSSSSIQNYKGGITCKETKNGTVKDLKIIGKSLVNICDSEFVRLNTGFYYCNIKNSILEANKEFTFKIFNRTRNSNVEWAIYGIRIGDVHAEDPVQIKDYSKDFSQYTTTIPSGYEYIRIYIRYLNGSDYTDIDISRIKCCIIKGNEFIEDYFEGITSVGNGSDNIKIESRKEDGNLFDKSKIINGKVVSGSNNDTMGDFIVAQVNSTSWNVTDYIPVYSNELYIGGLTNSVVSGSTINYGAFYDKNKKAVSTISYNINNDNFRIVVPQEAMYFAISVNNADIDNLYICTNSNKALEYKSDKKSILFKEKGGQWQPLLKLRGISNTIYDIIKKHDDDKHYLHIATNKITLNGSSGEAWLKVNESETTVVFRILSPSDSKFGIGIMCNKFSPLAQAWDHTKQKEGISFDSNGYTYVQILKSRLSATEVSDFRTWLQSNVINLIYTLSKEKVYEVSSLFLKAYDSKTLMFINSGIISSPMEFKLTSYITNLILNIRNRVDSLEDYSSQNLFELMMHNHDGRYVNISPQRLSESIDLNTVTTGGNYIVVPNEPNSPIGYGRMLVLGWDNSSKWVTQILCSDITADVYTRCATNAQATSWSPWKKFLKAGDSVSDNVYSKEEVNNLIQAEITGQRVRGISIANSLLGKL